MADHSLTPALAQPSAAGGIAGIEPPAAGAVVGADIQRGSGTLPVISNGGATSNANGSNGGTDSVTVPGANGSDNATDYTSWYHKACATVTIPTKNKSLKSSDPFASHGLLIEHGRDKTSTVFANNDLLWNGTPQILNYFFIGGTPKQREKVTQTIPEWTIWANVVFRPSSREESNIRITFDPDDGSWSYVGRQADKILTEEATMNLAWLDKASNITETEAAVILHEFGHVLGLFHEHQSPAHNNGMAVMNEQAALKWFRDTQKWSDAMIKTQVIDLYNMNDVSNFSQVDTKSIMHYPQPKQLTGLKEDIGYNFTLTDTDKAYMLLQYPRPTLDDRAIAQGWSYEKALDVIGAPADLRTKVLKYLNVRNPNNGEITPTNIRIAIEDWCRATFKGTNLPSPASSINPAHTTAAVNQLGMVSAAVLDGEDLCSTEVIDIKSSDDENGSVAKPAHAVVVQSHLWPLPDNGSAESIDISYYIRSTGSAATTYQVEMVTTAFSIWSAVTNIRFVEAPKDSPVDLVISFNNAIEPQPEKGPRSWCKMRSGQNKYGRRVDATRKLWDSLDTDIEYNGIFMDSNAAAAYKSTNFTGSSTPIDGKMLNLRSTVHELGHWLGLHHEYCGLYGYWMHTQVMNNPETPEAKKLAGSLLATRYDSGSIMDAIGINLQASAMEVIELKGLAKASVTQLQDKTNKAYRVMIALTLSLYDEANIALLYPGTNNLVDSINGSFRLKTLPEDSSISRLQSKLTHLKLYTETNFEAISSLLRAGKWQDARKAYLDMMQTQQSLEAKDKITFNKFIASQITVEPTGVKGIFDLAFVTNTNPQKPSSTARPIPKPARDVDVQPKAIVSEPAKAGDESFINILYQKLKTMYCPGGGQYFALQYPTRFLDKQTYAYNLDGYFSRFNKPVVVNEAEFNLTDALYPIAPIVGGPNGQTLSKNYEKALNSLIPTFESAEVRKQRERMRQWLLKETKEGNRAFTVDTRVAIPGIDANTARELSEEMGVTVTPGQTSTTKAIVDQAAAKDMARVAIEAVRESARADPRGMTRMEFSDSLMQTYLDDRKTWEVKRDDMITEASKLAVSDPQAMERLTRTLAHTTAIENAKLSSKHADAVVRGYSHTVRALMGHLDIKSVAETLQDAKDSLRESSMSSLYSASSVFPVAMQPADWFEALETGFTREDMSQDPSLIEAAVRAKGQLIDNLENQIANLRAFNRGDPAVAKTAMEAAAAKRETAISVLSQKYTASTIAAVKLAIEVAATTAGGPAVTAASRALKSIEGLPAEDPKKKSLTDLFGGDSTVLAEIGTQMDAVAVANAEVNSASRKLTEHMSEFSIATAGDTRTLVDGLQRQLTAAKTELGELQESYTIARRVVDGSAASTDAEKKLPELKDAGKLPAGNGGSRWSELHLSTTVSNDYTKSDSTSASSVSSFQCNFWIGSASGNSSQSEAKNIATTMGSTLKVEISMRVTYVTVDRSGWFDPSFFEMSKSFMRNDNSGAYSPWSEWTEAQNAEEAAKSMDNATGRPKGYLAAFPVGYILVKDTVLKISSNSTESTSFKKHFDQQAESSGGFLCFSHSSASRSSTDSSASSTVSAAGGVVVRIPGPQILGYIMQLTANDQTKPFVAMPIDELFLEGEDEDDAKENTKPVKPAPAHGIAPPGIGQADSSTGKRQATVRRYDDKFDDQRHKSSTSDGSGSSGGSGGRAPAPAHGVQGPPPSGKSTSHLIDALKLVIDDESIGDWMGSQSSVTRGDLMKRLEVLLSDAGKQ